ncbi:MAG: rhodanese-like domain-containing protein [Xanthomonadales bacterium]|nr:rhodanese-like domain-containing protein [Gammaproteobacteria bacterium]MBT8052998.1 rhodanese-like domain-containing protein [Gammaproteobacteria bacterium]NND57890.1 rhodanese-like domain-containing protein [Xanthomonadales bacterium]NNK50770.1 rhodanese-like domain-containing protein [Xanthomonadales bacterium]
MKRFLFSTAMLLAFVFFSSCLWASEPLWIDVRTADEYVSGHVDGAVNIPYTEITSRIGEVAEDKEAPIYVYCRSGRRSGIALESLQQAGFTNVVNVGGLEDARAKAADAAPE